MIESKIKILETATIAKYTLKLRPFKRLALPQFRCAPFRGGFGKALLEAVCPERECLQEKCPHRYQCAYSYIFETPVPKDAEVLRLNSNVAHPFIIEAPPDSKDVYGPDDVLELNLTLIGQAIDYLPYFVFAFERLGVMGLGRDRNKYLLKEVVSNTDNNETLVFSGRDKRFVGKGERVTFASVMNGRSHERKIWLDEQSIEIAFLSPGRFEYDGEMVTRNLEFHILLRSLLRRISTLIYFHCGRLKLPVDFKQLIDDAMGIEIMKNDLRWEEYERYSSRKGKRMKLGGVTGRISYKGYMEQFLPYLLIAEYIHAGKAVSFGFGHIVVR